MDMRNNILTVAQKLVQQRGFNGFSYADIAKEVGIAKASLHHHFATKADLGVALIDTYSELLSGELARIGASPLQANQKLAEYAAVYRSALSADRMCLGGMLASEVLTLDPALVPGLNKFFSKNVTWLTEILEEGVSQQIFELNGSAKEHATALLSSFQGALMLARSSGDHAAFEQTISLLSKSLMRKS